MDLGVRVTHVSYPDAPLCVCVRGMCVCACVTERVCWVGVMVTTRLFGPGEELKMSTACFSPASVLSSAHSPTLLQLPITRSLQSASDLTCIWFIDWLIFLFDDDDHSCMPDGLPLLHFVKRVLNMCLWVLCPVACWISWYAVMNGLHLSPVCSAMPPSAVMTCDCSSCHPTLNDASVIRLSSVWFCHCGFSSNSSELFSNIAAWKLKWSMSFLLIVSLTWAKCFSFKWRKTPPELIFAALLRLTFLSADMKPFWFDSLTACRDASQTLSLLLAASFHPVTVGLWQHFIKSESSTESSFSLYCRFSLVN